MRVLLQPADIVVGKAFDRDIFNAAGQRVFRKGFVINSPESRQRLLKMSLYADGVETHGEYKMAAQGQQAVTASFVATETIAAASARHRKVITEYIAPDKNPRQMFSENVFSFLDYCVNKEQKICESICAGSTDQLAAILELADDVLHLYQMSPSACLAAVHIDYEHPGSSLQPIYMALLCLDVAVNHNFAPDMARRLVCAALTADLGMFDYFDYLINRISPLSDEERKIMQQHPEMSCRFLQGNGVTDELWLKIVMQHHERSDGKGYPFGLIASQICDEAVILGSVVWYLSMIMQRAYFKPMPPKIALQKIFQSVQNGADKRKLMLIKNLGIYPPGSLVKLANQEVAIVVERNTQKSLSPLVACIGQIGGRFYAKPIFRRTDSQVYAINDVYISEQPVEVDLNEIWGRHGHSRGV